MKILQIMAGASVGGAETFFVDAVKAIDEIGYQQEVITRHNNQNKIDTISNLNIPLHKASFNKILSWTTSKTIKDAIYSFNPEIVHHWMGRAGTYSTHGQHTNIGWYGGYYKPERFKNCHYHVAVTKDIADYIVQQGIEAKRVFTLHIYAEFPPALPINRAEFDTPEDVPLLLSLSRLHQKKGLDTLIKAMNDIPDAYLWIAGSGPLDKELKALTKEMKLEDRIRFLGWRNDREALLATADIIVFPSRYEPFGAVVIEAWATEKPLVAAKAQGPKAYVTHEENGLLVEVDDVKDLATSVNRVITDNNLCSHIVSNGKTAYDHHFTKKVFQKNISDLYAQVKR